MTPAFIKWKTLAGEEKYMRFDAVLSENHENSVTPTMHSVEQGGDATDHLIPEPVRLTLEVQVTQTPIQYNDLWGNKMGVVGPYKLDVPENKPSFSPTPGAVFGAIGSAVKSLFSEKREPVATVFKFSRERNFLAEAQEQLWGLMDDATEIEVWTSTRVYESMYIISAPMTRSAGKGEVVNFQLTFQKLRIVNAEETEAPREHIAKKKVSKGVQQPEEDPKKQSVLSYALGDAFKKLFGKE